MGNTGYPKSPRTANMTATVIMQKIHTSASGHVTGGKEPYPEKVKGRAKAMMEVCLGGTAGMQGSAVQGLG